MSYKAFIDTGSKASIIRQSVAKELNADECSIKIWGICVGSCIFTEDGHWRKDHRCQVLQIMINLLFLSFLHDAVRWEGGDNVSVDEAICPAR